MSRLDKIEEILKKAHSEVSSFVRFEVTRKEGFGDILTEADLAANSEIKSFLTENFPDEDILSEEDPESQTKLGQDNWSGWVIDPIDGTFNFSRSIPYWGISIGYIENGEPLSGGIISNQGDIYLAEKGEGAFGPEGKMSVSKKREFNLETRVATSVAIDQRSMDLNLKRVEAIRPIWLDCLGSAVLIMKDVARGALDLYQHAGLKPWDNPAGFLLVKEAGGVVLNFRGEDADWREGEVVLGNENLAFLFLEKIKNKNLF